MRHYEILNAALKTSTGDRQDAYGNPLENHDRIARLWSTILGVTVYPYQVALCMAAVKISRLVANPTKLDSWIDGAAYMAIGGELAPDERRPSA